MDFAIGDRVVVDERISALATSIKQHPFARLFGAELADGFAEFFGFGGAYAGDVEEFGEVVGLLDGDGAEGLVSEDHEAWNT